MVIILLNFHLGICILVCQGTLGNQHPTFLIILVDIFYHIVSFTELNTSLDLVGTGGKFLQCAKPLESLEMEKLQHGKTLILVDVKKAFLSFLSRSEEEIQTLLFGMRDGAVGKVMVSCTYSVMYSEPQIFSEKCDFIQVVTNLEILFNHLLDFHI